MYLCSMSSSVSPKKYSFPLQARLRRKKSVETLFKQGQSFYLHPFKVVYVRFSESVEPVSDVQVLISVGKKHFKKAVDRNRIKRQIREGWRLQHHKLSQALSDRNEQLHLALIYTAKEQLESPMIHHKIKTIIQRLTDQYETYP